MAVEQKDGWRPQSYGLQDQRQELIEYSGTLLDEAGAVFDFVRSYGSDVRSSVIFSESAETAEESGSSRRSSKAYRLSNFIVTAAFNNYPSPEKARRSAVGLKLEYTAAPGMIGPELSFPAPRPDIISVSTYPIAIGERSSDRGHDLESITTFSGSPVDIYKYNERQTTFPSRSAMAELENWATFKAYPPEALTAESIAHHTRKAQAMSETLQLLKSSLSDTALNPRGAR